MRRVVACVLGGVVLLGAPFAVAQELVAAEPAAAEPTAERRGVEEIIVTAQKTEQRLRDVPISMSVMDADFLAELGVTDFDDVSKYAGNFKVNNEGGVEPPPDIRIRGFGTAQSNRAFEQSVGLSIDGDTFGRQEFFQAALFDIERVEVLKGPQGTLFGKNTTAGLLNVVLAEPSDELEGVVDLQIGELGRRRFETAIGGPVVEDWLLVRVAGLVDERDGLVRNTTSATLDVPDRLGDRRREALRVKLEVPSLLGARFRLTGEHVEFDVSGIPSEISEITEPALQDFYEKYDPNVDTQAGNYVSSSDEVGFANRRIRRLVANGSREIFGWDVELIAGYSTLDSPSLVEVDASPAPVGYGNFVDESDQVTVELRANRAELTGLLGLGQIFGWSLGTSELTTGFFYQRRTYDAVTDVGLSLPVFVEWTLASEGISPVPVGADLMRDLPLTFLLSEFAQTTVSYAGFAHLEWQPIDRWTVEYGMRLTQETKDARVRNYFMDPASEAAFSALGVEGFDLRGLEYSKLAFTPKVAIRHDLTDEMNVFGSWTRGFKAGGFNQQPTTPSIDGINYEDEVVESFEVGSKSRFFDGLVSLDVQLFWMEAEDLQVLTVRPEGLLGTLETVNAGKARSRGVEVDGTWLATDWLTFRASGGFDDAKYLEYPFGTCETDRVNTDGDGDPRCDLSGQPLPFTPKWNGTLTSSFRYPLEWTGLSLAPGVEWFTNLTAHYEDVSFISRANDPRTREPSFVTLDLQFGLTHPEQGWTFLVSGENLTDEQTRYLRSILEAPGDFRDYVNPGRLWFAGFRWAF